jgi:hypothetical protein
MGNRITTGLERAYPMRVYHFLSAQYALKTLYEHRIKISTFPDLNDPFELWPFKIDSVEDQEGFERATHE